MFAGTIVYFIMTVSVFKDVKRAESKDLAGRTVGYLG